HSATVTSFIATVEKPIQAKTLVNEANSSRGRAPRGTARDWRRATAMPPSRIAASTPASPRANSGGQSWRMTLMSGQLSAQPTEVMTRQRYPIDRPLIALGTGAAAGRLAADPRQAPLEVGDDVRRCLEAHREPDQALADARRAARVRADPAMGGAGRMRDRGPDVAHVRGDRQDAAVVDDRPGVAPPGGIVGTGDIEGHDRAAGLLLRHRQAMLRMRLEPGIVH